MMMLLGNDTIGLGQGRDKSWMFTRAEQFRKPVSPAYQRARLEVQEQFICIGLAQGLESRTQPPCICILSTLSSLRLKDSTARKIDGASVDRDFPVVRRVIAIPDVFEEEEEASSKSEKNRVKHFWAGCRRHSQRRKHVKV